MNYSSLSTKGNKRPIQRKSVTHVVNEIQTSIRKELNEINLNFKKKQK